MEQTESREIPQNYMARLPYDNFKIYHPDGTLMCFCSKKKANWYLKNDLAYVESEGKIVLKFRPKGYGDPEEILVGRKNCCVITGDTVNLTKHHVIPTQYRQHFDTSYKDKNSCDLVVLRRDKHDEYEDIANLFKIQLHSDYVDDSFIDATNAWSEAKGIYNCIKNHYDKLPPERQVYMTCRLEGLVDKWKFTDDELKSRSLSDSIERNRLIVNNIGVTNLIVLWKLHFLKYGKPNFMPTWWKPNMLKIVNKNNHDRKTDMVEIDMTTQELSKLIKKYELDEIANLYI
jgi:hypothetical protein